MHRRVRAERIGEKDQCSAAVEDAGRISLAGNGKCGQCESKNPDRIRVVLENVSSPISTGSIAKFRHDDGCDFFRMKRPGRGMLIIGLGGTNRKVSGMLHIRDRREELDSSDEQSDQNGKAENEDGLCSMWGRLPGSGATKQAQEKERPHDPKEVIGHLDMSGKNRNADGEP